MKNDSPFGGSFFIFPGLNRPAKQVCFSKDASRLFGCQEGSRRSLLRVSRLRVNLLTIQSLFEPELEAQASESKAGAKRKQYAKCQFYDTFC
jgi:hypothetical protein